MRLVKCIAFLVVLAAANSASAAEGWLNWRGPDQSGVAQVKRMPTEWHPGAEGTLWSLDLAGRGTPVIADGVLYAMGYRGEGADLRELLIAVDAETGEIRWEIHFRDFLSDIIYNRYAISSPTVDPETGVIYAQTSNGVLFAANTAGELLWDVSMMEYYGRLSFPNGRTGSPVVDGDRVIVHGITANWGRHGPARDRFYAFDKRTGALDWVSTPGIRPVDSSFSTPYIENRDGVRQLYAGTGCGQIVAVNVNSGTPVWRAPVSIGGVNVSVVVHEDTLIAVHSKENLDDNTMGRMVAFDLNAKPQGQEDGTTPVLDAEVWRKDISSFTSSPVLADGVLYQVSMTGELHAIDPTTGERLWHEKLGPDQLHASPLFADGKLYIPFQDGSFVIGQPSRKGFTLLSRVQMAGNALGAPIPYRGRVYVHTTEKLYAIGDGKPQKFKATKTGSSSDVASDAVALQVLPAEFVLESGNELDLRARTLDAKGYAVSDAVITEGEAWIPPTAKVRATLAGQVVESTLKADVDAGFSAGAFRLTAGDLSGTTRGRTLPEMPYAEDFEGFDLAHARGDLAFAYPPLAWIGARFKWEVQDIDGSKVLAKTLSKMIFQRSMAFIGHPESSNYQMQASVKVDGNRRTRSTVGLVHQRYIVALKGNQRQLEVSSNYERFRHGVPFTMESEFGMC